MYRVGIGRDPAVKASSNGIRIGDALEYDDMHRMPLYKSYKSGQAGNLSTYVSALGRVLWFWRFR